MPSGIILMNYKESCKVEGEITTRLKMARLYFGEKKKQKEIALMFGCHPNTVNDIARKCKKTADLEAWHYLKNNAKISGEKLLLFYFLINFCFQKT